MRMAFEIAAVIAASALLAGCSATSDDQPARSMTALTTPSSSASTPPTTTARPTTGTPPGTARPPAAGAPIGDLIGWIEAGTPAEASAYRTATRGGVATDLGDDVAFTGPSGTPNCMTDRRFDGALACLVDLADPPAEAPDTYGQWKGGWVDFPGRGVDIGSSHGDPGRFGSGLGPELPAGRSLTFGDYGCRVDGSDVYCVDYADRTGVRFAATGIEGFGCLRRAAPPEGIGDHLSC
ncbi:hypothetical protein [Mycolicibacterium sediminis]|nr:hypothetical protein [Mycolicibacterium sediminis]